MVFFTFPEDARWNPDRDAVESASFSIPYEGTVRIGRRVFQEASSISRRRRNGALKRSTLQRTRFELIVERKLRRRQLTDDGNVEITGRDLREKAVAVGQHHLFADASAHV